jgi:oxygen-dependent protoporphyrinogen oxidase
MSDAASCTGSPFRVAVIGGGIAGLAAAHHLGELQPGACVHLYEAGDRLGGALRTDEVDGYLIERGADSFITQPADAVELCHRLGMADELIGTVPQFRTAYVVHRGRLKKLPAGFALMAAARVWPLVTTPILSWSGKARLAAEPLIAARRSAEDESFASFARRRLGREAYERLVQPLVSGIYTADPERLSMQAALPRFVDMEQQHGSLFRAMRRQSRYQATDGTGARYEMFVTPRRGLGSLVAALAAKLPANGIALNQRVSRIEPIAGGGFKIVLSDADESAHEYDAVIVATAAPQAAGLIESFASPAAKELARIEYAGCAIAVLGCRRDQVAHPLDAFGFVVPEVERRKILSASFSSVKFPGRAPQDRVLIRVFVGGACHPDLQELNDTEMRRVVLSELAELIGLSGEPELFQVSRWQGRMPQYHVGHRERVARIESALGEWPRLALAGNGYRGVGIPLCIADGRRAAGQIMASAGSLRA